MHFDDIVREKLKIVNRHENYTAYLRIKVNIPKLIDQEVYFLDVIIANTTENLSQKVIEQFTGLQLTRKNQNSSVFEGMVKLRSEYYGTSWNLPNQINVVGFDIRGRKVFESDFIHTPSYSDFYNLRLSDGDNGTVEYYPLLDGLIVYSVNFTDEFGISLNPFELFDSDGNKIKGSYSNLTGKPVEIPLLIRDEKGQYYHCSAVECEHVHTKITIESCIEERNFDYVLLPSVDDISNSVLTIPLKLVFTKNK